MEQYKRIAREVEEKAKKEIGQVQSEVQQYQRQAKEFEGIADTLNKQQKALDLRVAQAQNEKKRMTQQYEREAKRVASCGTALKIVIPITIPLWGKKQPGFRNWNKNGEKRLFNGRPFNAPSGTGGTVGQNPVRI